MRWTSIVALGGGTILVLLGALWFLQGSDLIHLKPILCVADCEPLVGRSLQWQVVGAITFLIGSALLGLGTRRIRRRRAKRTEGDERS